jgi:hypothetical protein
MDQFDDKREISEIELRANLSRDFTQKDLLASYTVEIAVFMAEANPLQGSAALK